MQRSSPLARNGQFGPPAPGTTFDANSAVVPALALASIFFLPPALTYLLNASSFLTGTMVVCALAFGGYAAGVLRVRDRDALPQAVLLAAGVAAFALAHLFISLLFRPVALGRAVATLPVLLIFLIAAPIVQVAVFERSDRVLDRAMTIIFGCYALSALLSSVGLQPPGYYGEKPVFPFSEPSFFAFTICPVMIYFCCTRPFVYRWLALLLLFGLAVRVSNLTTIAAALLVMLTFARWWQIAAAVLGALVIWPYVDQQYFLERLSFSEDSTNLTSLVYVQGWQLLGESLRSTHGWGLGLQQLGAGYTNTVASYRINQLLGHDLNLLDGGFLLSKLGSEFGVFGFVALGSLMGLAGKVFLRLRASARGDRALPRNVVLAYSSVVGSSIEILLRGSTYFTGTVLLLIASLLFLRSSGKQAKVS